MEDKEKGAARSFLISFLITFTIVMSIVGLLIVDYHGRSMSMADNTPVVHIEKQGKSYILELTAFEKYGELEVTGFVNAWRKFLDFCCLPVKDAY